MKLSISILFITAAIIMNACNSNSSSTDFTVSGVYKNAQHPAFAGPGGASAAVNPVKKVYLYEVPFGVENTPVALDSGALSGDNGQFRLKSRSREEGVYELVFDNGYIVLLSNDAPEVEVDIDLAKKDNYYSVKGSEASQQMKDFTISYTDRSQKVNRAFSQMDSLKRFNAADSLIMAATTEKNNQIRILNDYLKDFISKTSHPSVALFALGWASRSFAKAEFETALNEILTKFPRNTSVVNLKKSYDLQQAQLADMQKKQKQNETRENIWVGKMAPDFALPDTKGQLKSISSFRGKYLLVDFWASWCRPCRMENPNLVSAYNQFRNKNFTILGVSLDKDKDDWINAIQDDQLSWTHISDLQFWNSKAVEIFRFDGIPYNILIDPSGKVIAESLRGEDLVAKLKEVLP